MVLGIELGSTRIKAVLTDNNGKTISVAAYEWSDSLVNGLWSYSLDDVEKGLRTCYKSLKENYKKTFDKNLTIIDAIGISAMMHGYLAFDKNLKLLTPFRTWRNTNTSESAKELSKELNFNMPMRWSASHLYQAVLNKEEHVKDVDFITTLSGYVHMKLTGEKVLGIGDASGMFPIKNGCYDGEKAEIYNKLLKKHGINKDITKLLPKILYAGKKAGYLTKEGAKFLDPSGELEEGAVFCAPEGDAQTGMVATNSVKVRTGNVSAGTSAFVMVVLEKPLKKVYPEIDITATPNGNTVAMVHANNCTSEINAWVNLFDEVLKLCGKEVDKGDLFTKLFEISAESDENVGNLYACNFFAGEPIVNAEKGRPMLLRMPESKLNIANFMQSQIYSAVAPLYAGMKILKNEDVKIDGMCGHGGYFKTKNIGQKAMSLALGAKITVYKNAGEGGAYGIALLALYTMHSEENLDEFLDKIYKDEEKSTLKADENEEKRFKSFMSNYIKGNEVEIKAGEVYNA